MNILKLTNHIFTVAILICLLTATSAYSQTTGKGNTDRRTIKTTQEYVVKGQVLDLQDYTPLPSVTVYLMKTDSTQVGMTTTNENGEFTFNVERRKLDYIVKVSCVGFVTRHKLVHVLGKNTVLESFKMEQDETLLENVEVTGNLPKVQAVEDTLIYNADAYRLPAGSVLEELIERLPGAEVEDGKITINGREVKKILLDGKEFFVGDMNTAMKNIPTAIVDKLKHYDEKSDMAKVTGIDDGEENPVLDVRIKKGMNRGYNVNADAGYGTHDLYAERLNANMFQENMKLSFTGNANNANNRSTPGRGGRGGSNGNGGGSNGRNSSKSLGFNINYDNRKTLLLDGNVRWNHSNSDALSVSSSESFVSRTGAFSNSSSSSKGRNDGLNAEFRIEWKPTPEWNIQLRPKASTSTNDRLSSSMNASFNSDPFLYVTNPLDEINNFGIADTIRVNSRQNSSISYSRSTNYGLSIQVNKKFGSDGRNLTFRAEGSQDNREGNSITNNLTHYYKVKSRVPGMTDRDSLRFTNRYNENPSMNRNFFLQVTYSEPIFKNTFLQFSYQFQYRYNDSSRDTYDFIGLNERFGEGVVPGFRSWDEYLATVDGGYQKFYDDSLSSYSSQRNLIHNLNLSLRFVREKYNLSLGVRYTPQIQHFDRDYLRLDTAVSRTTYNVSPTLTFRYRFSRQHTLNVDYHGNTSQPSITQLLDIKDDSNPLNISMGNPNLKPSYTNNLNVRYNKSIVERRQSIAATLSGSFTLNSISNKVTYDEQTGGRTTQPDNINGNWNTNGNFLFTSALDKAANWNISTSTDVRYSTYVNYLNINRIAVPEKNKTTTTTMSERFSGSYRNTWLEVELNSRVNYTKARNELQSTANRDTWQYSYGCSFNIKLPWEMTIDTSINQMSRRGYSDASFNTDEFVWNGQITQQILPKRKLVVTLQFYDILHQQSNYSRQISENRRSDTWHNSVNSYAMLHIIYQFRNFGGRAGRQMMRNREFTNFGENGENGENGSEFGNGNNNNNGSFGGNNRGGGFGGGNRGGGRRGR